LSDLQEEGYWVWASEKNVAEYTNWRSGEPNNTGKDENCVSIYSNHLWNDYACSKLFHYICEKYDE